MADDVVDQRVARLMGNVLGNLQALDKIELAFAVEAPGYVAGMEPPRSMSNSVRST
jgi:hypothetical protein